MFRIIIKIINNWKEKRRVQKEKDRLIASLDERGLYEQSALIEALSSKK